MMLRHVLNRFPGLVRGVLPALAAVLFLAAAAAPQAESASLDELRRSGVLAERYDGYVIVRQNAAGAQQAAAQINAQRRALYGRRAQQQGVPVDQVGRVYARQIWAGAPRGTWFLDASNRWVQKR